VKPIFGFQLQGLSVTVVALRLVAPTLVGVAIAIFFFAIFSSKTRVASRLGLRGLKRQRALASNELWSNVEPLVRWLGVRVSGIPSEAQRTAIDEQIGLAGDYMGLTADEFIALTILSVLGGIVVGVGAGIVFDLGGMMVIIGALIGGALPYMQVSGVAQERLKQVSRGLPYFIDVMALCMGAGLDFPGAIRKVVEQSSNPDDALVEEFTLILQTLNLGRTRKEALLEFSRRCPVDAAVEFANSLIQAEERGNPVAEVLTIQATISRQRRSVRAEELAAKAGVKMVGPLMLVFFCVMGLLLGPAIMQITSGL
jgi:tight adherence protein C